MPGELTIAKDVVRATSLPPTAKVAMAARQQKKEDAEEEAGAKGKIGFNVVAKQVRSMGKAYAAYQRQRAKAKAAEAADKDGPSQQVKPPAEAATTPTDASAYTPTVTNATPTTLPSSMKPSRFGPTQTLSGTRQLPSIPGSDAGASEVPHTETPSAAETVVVDIPEEFRDMSTLVDDDDNAGGGKAAGAAPPAKRALVGLFQKAVRGVTAAMRFRSTLQDPPSVTLLVDMDPKKFSGTVSQQYFLRELADELDISDARLRVKHYDSYTGAVVIQVLQRPGEIPAEMVISRLESMLAEETLLLDPDFGDVSFVEKDIPSQKQPKAPVSGKGAGESLGGGEGAEAEPTPVPQAIVHKRPKCERILLVSNRIIKPTLVLAAARDNVATVFFDYRFGTLEKILYDVRHRMRDHADTRAVKSIGLLTQWKPGSFGLVKGLRTSLKNLAKPALRGFWSEMASLLVPSEGRIDFLGADARDRLTKRLLIDLSEMTRHGVTTAGSEMIKEHGPGGFLVDIGGGLNPYDNSINSAGTADLYFAPEKLREWRMAVAENGSPFVAAEKPRARDVDVSLSVVNSAVRWMAQAGVRRGRGGDGKADKQMAAAYRSAAVALADEKRPDVFVPPLNLVQFADERKPVLMTAEPEDLPVDAKLEDLGIAQDDEPMPVPRLPLAAARARAAPRGSGSRIEDEAERIGEELELILEEMKSREKLNLPPIVRLDDHVRKQQAYAETGIWASRDRPRR